MASFNPYAMDPALAQGFSALTKSLIGDAGTDLDVARRKRIETLLPYEVKSEQARANASNAAADSSRARAQYLAAMTLTEEGKRSAVIEKAKTDAANAIKQGELLDAQTKTQQAQAGMYNSQTATEDQRRPFIVAKDQEAVNTQRAETDATKAQEQSRIAEAMLNDAKTKTENETRQSTVELSEEKVRTQQEETKKVESEARANIAAALKNNAERKRIEELLPGEIEKLRAEIATENAATGEKNANIAKTKAETETQNANTANVQADTRLKDAQTKKAGMTTVNAGQTVFWTDENGKQQSFTAKETTQIKLGENEQVVVRYPDGSEQTYTGPKSTTTQKTDDVIKMSDQVDAEIEKFANAFEGVDSKIIAAVRGNLSSDLTQPDKTGKVMSEREQINTLRRLLSQTYNGQQTVDISTGVFSGFAIPGFVANQIANNGEGALSERDIMSMYGLSKEEAQAAIAQLRK